MTTNRRAMALACDVIVQVRSKKLPRGNAQASTRCPGQQAASRAAGLDRAPSARQRRLMTKRELSAIEKHELRMALHALMHPLDTSSTTVVSTGGTMPTETEVREKAAIDIKKTAAVAQPVVVREDVPRIVVPITVSYEDAAKYCAAKDAEAKEVIAHSHSHPCLPWVGAFAVQRTLDQRYSAVPTKDRSKQVMVPGAGGSRKIVWGEWDVHGLGRLAMGADISRKGLTFRMTVQAVRSKTEEIERFFADVDQEIARRELYAGCALQFQCDDDGVLQIMEPLEAIPLSDVTEADVILSRLQSRALAAELFLPIRKPEAVEALGVPSRRGVLLSGRPGTGKTLTAKAAAKLAADLGWTVFYLPDARGLEVAFQVAAGHAPALLICEDLDRQLGKTRDAMTDRILNALDGLDRSARVIFIATTNNSASLPPALLRPGRLDSFMEFGLPDAEAAGLLLRKYLGARCPDHLNGAAEACAGLLPASIREVASRSILHALSAGRDILDPEDIQEAAQAVRDQQSKLEEAEARKVRMPAMRVFQDIAPGGEVLTNGGVLVAAADVAKRKGMLIATDDEGAEDADGY